MAFFDNVVRKQRSQRWSIGCRGREEEFIWTEPWKFDNLLDVQPWVNNQESPVPEAVDQGRLDYCIPFAAYGTMTIQMALQALYANVPAPPKLSLKHLELEFRKLHHSLRRWPFTTEFIERIGNDGIVAEQDFERRHDPMVKRYHFKNKQNLDPRSYVDKEKFYQDLETDLLNLPLLAEIVVGPNYTTHQPVLYNPRTEPPREREQPRPPGHAITLIGWRVSLQPDIWRRRQTRSWVYLNSWGTNWGYNGLGELVKGGLFLVYGAEVEDWWTKK